MANLIELAKENAGDIFVAKINQVLCNELATFHVIQHYKRSVHHGFVAALDEYVWDSHGIHLVVKYLMLAADCTLARLDNHAIDVFGKQLLHAPGLTLAGVVGGF